MKNSSLSLNVDDADVGTELQESDNSPKETASVRKKRVAARQKTPFVEKFQKKRNAAREIATVIDESSSESDEGEVEDEGLQVPGYESIFSELHGLSKKSTSNNNLSQ